MTKCASAVATQVKAAVRPTTIPQSLKWASGALDHVVGHEILGV